jgi:hypothetical protein
MNLPIRLLISVALVSCAIAATAAQASSGTVYAPCYPKALASAAPKLHAVAHPALCDLLIPPPDSADLLQLRDARWMSWGASTTTAKGRGLNNNPGMGGAASFAVTVKLSKVGTGCNGRRYYTRITVNGHTKKLIDACKTT